MKKKNEEYHANDEDENDAAILLLQHCSLARRLDVDLHIPLVCTKASLKLYFFYFYVYKILIAFLLVHYNLTLPI